MGLRSGVGRGSGRVQGGRWRRWWSLGGRSGVGWGSWAGSAWPGLLRRLVTAAGFEGGGIRGRRGPGRDDPAGRGESYAGGRAGRTRARGRAWGGGRGRRSSSGARAGGRCRARWLLLLVELFGLGLGAESYGWWAAWSGRALGARAPAPKEEPHTGRGSGSCMSVVLVLS